MNKKGDVETIVIIIALLLFILIIYLVFTGVLKNVIK